MPLDPVFSERLRVHRRYLFSQALQLARARVESLGLPPRTGRRSPTAAGPLSATGRAAPTGRAALTARERHRRAARMWDKVELDTVGTPGPDVETSEFAIETPGYPDVRVRAYVPPGAAERPAVLAFFGGAFRIGGIDYPTTDAANRRRAAEADVIVLAVDYALAPEHRFPTQVAQGHAALEWLFAHALELGIDANRVAIAGTSAGAAIAASVALMNRDRGDLPLLLQLLEVPVVDLTGRHIDLRATWALGVPAILALRELRSIARTYLRSRNDSTHPWASPLRAASHAGLPPAMILTAQYDPLRGQGAAYGHRLRRAGVDATVVQYQGVIHDVPTFTGVLPAARAWHAQVVDTLRGLHD